MKTFSSPILIMIGLLGWLTSAGLAQAPDNPKKTFDELCVKVQRGKGGVTENDLIQDRKSVV